MPGTGTFTDTITREEAVTRLRTALLALTDEENCICKVASERGVFCHGFSRFSDAELRDRYWWIVRKRPDIGRAELEKIANDWQLAQQDVRGMGIACDVQTKIHDTCRGWHDFSDEQLAVFYRQVTGLEIRVVS
jgi:hypothetical protein